MSCFNTWKMPMILWLAVSFVISAPFIFAGCGESEVAELRGELDDDEADERHDALKKLESFGPEAASAVDEVAELLSDPNTKIRYRAAKVLSKIGIEARSAAGPLSDALSDPDTQVRYFAAKAIDEFAGEPEAETTVDALIGVLGDGDPNVRFYAVKSLGKIGSAARPALGELELLIRDPEEKVRRAAEKAIRRIEQSKP